MEIILTLIKKLYEKKAKPVEINCVCDTDQHRRNGVCQFIY